MRPVFARRKQQGDYYQLVRELEIADAEYFGRYARFSPALLEEVLQLVGPHNRTLSDSPDSNRPKRTIDDDNQVINVHLRYTNKCK